MIDRKLLDVLACPICKAKLIYQGSKQELVCKFDRIAYKIKNGIPVMLESEGRKLTSDECKSIK